MHYCMMFPRGFLLKNNTFKLAPEVHFGTART